MDHKKLLSLLLSAGFACSIQLCAFAQDAPEGKLTRKGYETGLSYTDEPIGTEKIICIADDLSRVIDWGDNTGDEIIRSTAKASTLGVQSGTYTLFAKEHSYNRAGTFTATIKIRQHCSSRPPGTTEYTFQFPVQVFGHVPIQKIDVSTPRVPRGGIAKLEVTLSGIAPESNTRLFIQASDKVFANTPKFIDVTKNGTDAQLSIQVRQNAPIGITKLSLWTDPDANQRRSVSIGITR